MLTRNREFCGRKSESRVPRVPSGGGDARERGGISGASGAQEILRLFPELFE
jgi:hypothetical protein